MPTECQALLVFIELFNFVINCCCYSQLPNEEISVHAQMLKWLAPCHATCIWPQGDDSRSVPKGLSPKVFFQGRLQG